MSITAERRRELILEQVVSQGHVGVRDAAQEFDVSEATVRRDLRALADEGAVELVYGGATVRRSSDQSIQSRAQRHAEAKRTIGRLAGALVRDFDLLFVDSGTTCYEMRGHLLQRKGLTVVCNSTRLAHALAAKQDLSVVLIGGHYRDERMDTAGPLAANAIDQLRGYVAFIGADGLDPEFGISASDIQTAYLYQHVVKNARETILLVDHSKLTSPSLFRFAGLQEIGRVVTDRLPSLEWQGVLATHGIQLITPTPTLEQT